MTVTTHYIEDWQHHSAVLVTSPVAQLSTDDTDDKEPQRHTAPDLAHQLKNVAQTTQHQIWHISLRMSHKRHSTRSGTSA